MSYRAALDRQSYTSMAQSVKGLTLTVSCVHTSQGDGQLDKAFSAQLSVNAVSVSRHQGNLLVYKDPQEDNHGPKARGNYPQYIQTTRRRLQTASRIIFDTENTIDFD